MEEVPCEDPHHGAIFPRLPRHFLTGTELSRDELLALLARAHELKAAPRSSQALEGKAVALLFQRPSTRTRLSYEAASPSSAATPWSCVPVRCSSRAGESVADTARVLSRHVHAIGVRTGPDADLGTLAAEGSIPVFNMLTAGHHPSQALADLMTLQEAFPGRPLDELKLAYVGDGNNVARSLALVGGIAGLDVAVASPPGYELEPGCRRHAHRRRRPGGRRRARRVHRRVGLDGRRGDGRRPPRRARSYRIDERCSTPPRRARSPCTACPRTRARRSPPRCSTASASGSGTRPRTAGTRRRRCSSGCSPRV